jgi:hypothetical protein
MRNALRFYMVRWYLFSFYSDERAESWTVDWKREKQWRAYFFIVENWRQRKKKSLPRHISVLPLSASLFPTADPRLDIDTFHLLNVTWRSFPLVGAATKILEINRSTAFPLDMMPIEACWSRYDEAGGGIHGLISLVYGYRSTWLSRILFHRGSFEDLRWKWPSSSQFKVFSYFRYIFYISSVTYSKVNDLQAQNSRFFSNTRGLLLVIDHTEDYFKFPVPLFHTCDTRVM